MAYEAHTIELAELRGALKNLMSSPDMYAFWRKARAARGAVTGGDEAEDFFTTEIDRAFAAADPTNVSRGSRTIGSTVGRRIAAWLSRTE